jgi:hypothetical protein
MEESDDDDDKNQSPDNSWQKPKRKSSFPKLFHPSPQKWKAKSSSKEINVNNDSVDLDVPIKLLFSNSKKI